ncbi:MAG: protein kinase [Burkholderiales bacterium]|nr:protein kinase [Burkholderiales bacterium]
MSAPVPTPANPGALAPGTTLMEYRILSVLAADGFGITYLARDAILNRDVAIKEYFPADLARRAADGRVEPAAAESEPNFRKGLTQFLIEARTLARFVHPDIVRVDRVFEASGTAYMLREYEKGESLAQKLARGPRLDEAALKAIFAPLLDGLEAVHRAGVLHRDIKPGNIFIRDEGPPVLIDFGSARLASRDALHDIIPILTPGYAPAEHYIRSGGQGPWSDIYSAAAVLFHAVTGEAPPDALSRLRIDNVAKALGAARGHYSASFIDAIQWGLASHEQDRPQGVAQWRVALLGGVPSRAAPRPAPPPALDDTRKYVWVSLGVLIFYLFVAGADIVQQRAQHYRAYRHSVMPAERAATAAGARQSAPAAASGGLTREQFEQNLPNLAGRFSEIDTDRNGFVTTEELQNHLRRPK